MNNKIITAVIIRPGETTVAVVQADITEKITNSRELQKAIIKAVTFWMCKTPEGTAAYWKSKEDFNVGDLSNELGDEKLINYLRSVGVYNLDIETAESGADHWTFDDHLFDAGEVEEVL